MSVSFDPATQATLDAGRIVDRGLILFDLGSGLYGFWSGIGPMVWSGITFVGAGSLISVDNIRQTSDLSAVAVVARLRALPEAGLTPDILATIENEQYHQRPCTIYTAYFHPDTYALLSVELEYRGYIDQIVHTESPDGDAMLEARLESRFRDHLRTGYRVRSDADQRLISPTDDAFRHVATVGQETILFGRVATTADAAMPVKKKSFLQRIFG